MLNIAAYNIRYINRNSCQHIYPCHYSFKTKEPIVPSKGSKDYRPFLMTTHVCPVRNVCIKINRPFKVSRSDQCYFVVSLLPEL